MSKKVIGPTISEGSQSKDATGWTDANMAAPKDWGVPKNSAPPKTGK